MTLPAPNVKALNVKVKKIKSIKISYPSSIKLSPQLMCSLIFLFPVYPKKFAD